MIQKDSSMAAAFLAAKKYLSPTSSWSVGKSEFICIAIMYAQHAGLITENQMWAARKLISNRLSGHGVFNSWLKTHHPELYDDIDRDAHINMGRKLQKTRQAWLDSLIKEFS